MWNNKLERKTVRMQLPRTSSERLIAATLCPILALFFGLACIGLTGIQPRPLAAKFLVHVGVESCAAFCILLLLLSIWALFTPRWVEAVANRYTRRAVLAGLFLAVVGPAIVVLFL